jgi:hypothetical protein
MKDFIEIKNGNIDVKDIMRKIKERIENKKKEGIYTEKEIKEIEEMKPYPLPDIQDIHHFYSQHLYQEKKKSGTEEKKSPEQPSEEEMPKTPAEEIGLKKRIKFFLSKIMRPFSPLIKLLVLPVHEEIIETNEKLFRTDKNLEKLQSESVKLNEVMGKTIEYVKLLHNINHHLVAELTKLKVEKEGMKNKMRTLENKIEFLEKREKVVEKSVFKNE